jgi:hypothetical protein
MPSSDRDGTRKSELERQILRAHAARGALDEGGTTFTEGKSVGRVVCFRHAM